jgi:ATPase subunit of ABC transporter with duplicated ATPase domains
MSPRARQAKGQARLTRYEELVAEAQSVEKRADRLEIEIPFTRRLGDKVIVAKNLRKGYGDRLLIEDLEFNLPPAGIVGVIGPNGAGKTTLFRMITRTESPDSGTIEIGSSVDLAYVDQTRDALKAENTVYQEISGGLDIIKVGNREINSRAYVASLNFKGSDQQKKVGTLSGGERNRVHLAKMLRTGGNVILLDEPSNDLDVDTLRALEEALIAFPGCAVVISHDRWFLDRICTHILAFENDSQVHEYAQGKVRWFEGNWTEYETFITSRYGPDALMPKPRSRSRLIQP